MFRLVASAGLSRALCRGFLRESRRFSGKFRDGNSRPRFFITCRQYHGCKSFERALNYEDKVAVLDQHCSYTYRELVALSKKLSDELQHLSPDLYGQRIAFLTQNDASYVVCMWSSWLCGAVSVPLCKSHPRAEIEYVLQDSEPRIVISTDHYGQMIDELCEQLKISHYQLTESFMKDRHATSFGKSIERSKVSKSDGALIIYTSGTTGRPKGALWNHDNLNKQVDMMLNSWRWSKSDVMLHLLPLHHFHGIVNALLCPLTVGATVVLRNKFIPEETWKYLTDEIKNSPRISVLMAVPTIYVKLLRYYDDNLKAKSSQIKERCAEIRLMISGSAALPDTVFRRWEEVTSHKLLERYGMTEIGMTLTNPYQGPRIPGTVGEPFEGVEVKIVTEENEQNTIAQGNNKDVDKNEDFLGHQGQLLVRGPIFSRYWKRQEATECSFTRDGWFRTGDTVRFASGSFRIVGRTSVDIIKSGGYKISALDVERHLLENDDIAEVAVLGLPDNTWGHVVAAVISLRHPDSEMTLEHLRSWSKNKMAPYMIPKLLKIVDEIPRNAMGKVNKKALKKYFATSL